MALTAGSRFGTYEIQAALGAGGMGEVYRARDVRLGRDVAIKILPNAFSLDTDRLARFEREARVLASLNHPNIGAIYGIEEDHGARALVLELVEGETLAMRMLRGLPMREALDIARQIAEALDAAHERGIVHRDLKPSNVMVTPSGVVKVLDFGLAKASESTSSADLANSPTVTYGVTAQGVLLGTAQYMSPEQARGHIVDKRCDLWAFGCVLFELLTLRRAFEGATVTDTIAAIIEREPDLGLLPPSTPAGIRQLLRRCLAKNPSRRMRDAGDVTHEIEAAIAELDSPIPATATRKVWGWSTISAAAIALVAVAAAAGFVARRGTGAAPTPPDTTSVMTRITADDGLTIEPSISTDGRLVAYASNRSGENNLDVYVQQTGGGASIRLTSDPADDREPDVSPDGSLVAFRSERNPRGVYIAAALGSGARFIAPDGMMPRFSPDGRTIAFWTGGWLAPRSVGNIRRTFIVPTEGGAAVQVAKDLASAGDPVWSPDGRALLVYGRKATSGANTEPDWWRVPVDGGTSTPTGAWAAFKERHIALDSTDTHPHPSVWMANGAVIFGAELQHGDSQVLWRLFIDDRSGRVAGPPEPITNGTTLDTSPSVARDGRLVFAAETAADLIFGMPFDGNGGKALGPLRRLREDAASTGRSSISEDGRFLAFPKYEFASGSLWLRDLPTGRERQLGATPRTPLNPVISVDGSMVGYTITATETGGSGGPGAGYVVEVNGGIPRKICDNCQVHLLTRDNRQVIVSEPGEKSLFRIDINSGARTDFITWSRGELDRPMIGPNSKWVTFNATGAVYLAPIHPDRPSPEAEWTRIVETTQAGRTAGMSPDGRLLYVLLVRDGFRCLYALKIDPQTGHPLGEPYIVAHFHDESRRWGSTGRGSAVSANLFVAILTETKSNIWMTTIGDTRAH